MWRRLVRPLPQPLRCSGACLSTVAQQQQQVVPPLPPPVPPRPRAVAASTSGSTGNASAINSTPEFALAAATCSTMIKQMASKVRRQREERAAAAAACDDAVIHQLAREGSTRLSLRDLHSFSDSAAPKLRIQQARFLHRELPIRFAQRAVELENLPFGLSDKQAVKDAAGWYKHIVRSLLVCPEPTTQEQEEQYGNMLASLLLEHTQVPQALSRAVMELKASASLTSVEQHRVDQILNSFFLSRIAMRFLVEQYIASKRHRPGFRGMIQDECSPVEVAHKAKADVARLCRYHLGFAPEVQVIGCAEHTFTAVPSHLYYILCELLKNSCRATAVHCGAVNEDGSPRAGAAAMVLPPIKVIVARGREDIAIKVMDEGGGIRRSDLQHVWSYMYSSAPQPSPHQFEAVSLDHMTGPTRRQLTAELEAGANASNGVPAVSSTFAFAGYGMGLPLSRLYARYFGGSLKLRPMEGYGTDAYLHMHRLRTNSRELIPESLTETLKGMGNDGRMCTGKTPWRRRMVEPGSKDDSAARTLIRQCCVD